MNKKVIVIIIAICIIAAFTIPAFISENVLNILIQNYNIGAISTPQEDLEKLLKVS